MLIEPIHLTFFNYIEWNIFILLILGSVYDSSVTMHEPDIFLIFKNWSQFFSHMLLNTEIRLRYNSDGSFTLWIYILTKFNTTAGGQIYLRRCYTYHQSLFVFAIILDQLLNLLALVYWLTR